MPRTPEQYQQIRDEKKRLIMNTALELFAGNGFHRTSISDIARHAGISKGLLYNYFVSKEELVVEMMKDGFVELIVSLDTNRDTVLANEEMKSFINELLQSIIKRSHFWRLYFAVISQPIVNKTAYGEIMEIATPLFKLLSDYFAKMGYENPEAESRFFAALLDGIICGVNWTPQPAAM